jgi:hypothetical protein
MHSLWCCLAASVVGCRWSLEEEEPVESKVRNVDIAKPGAVWGAAAGPFRDVHKPMFSRNVSLR